MKPVCRPVEWSPKVPELFERMIEFACLENSIGRLRWQISLCACACLSDGTVNKESVTARKSPLQTEMHWEGVLFGEWRPHLFPCLSFHFVGGSTVCLHPENVNPAMHFCVCVRVWTWWGTPKVIYLCLKGNQCSILGVHRVKWQQNSG